jgi:hypothetical protein
VAEHNIAGNVVVLAVVYMALVVLVAQPAKIYNHILHKTLHYLDFENHTLDNISPYIFKYGNMNMLPNGKKSLYYYLF